MSAGPPCEGAAPDAALKGQGVPGTLYLVPAPLDFGCDDEAPLQDTLPAGTLQAAAGLTHWVCENAKSARAYLKRVDAIVPLAAPLQAQTIQELPREVHKKGDHLGPTAGIAALMAPLRAGHDMGLLSEAGMPAVADPGASIVRAAHEAGARGVPLVGPVSLLLTLAASGLNGQNFAFVGYLPQEGDARRQRIRELEGLALRTGQTQLFIETPYRNAALLQALLQTLQPGTRLAVASGLTLPAMHVRSQAVKAWRAAPALAGERLPAVFAVGA